MYSEWELTPWYSPLDRKFKGKYRRLLSYYGVDWWEYSNTKD